MQCAKEAPHAAGMQKSGPLVSCAVESEPGPRWVWVVLLHLGTVSPWGGLASLLFEGVKQIDP